MPVAGRAGPRAGGVSHTPRGQDPPLDRSLAATVGNRAFARLATGPRRLARNGGGVAVHASEEYLILPPSLGGVTIQLAAPAEKVEALEIVRRLREIHHVRLDSPMAQAAVHEKYGRKRRDDLAASAKAKEVADVAEAAAKRPGATPRPSSTSSATSSGRQALS